MTSRVVISSVQNFVALLKKYPKLAEMPAFTSVVHVVKQAASPAGKGCSPCKAKKVLNNNRQVFEAAITSLQEHEKSLIKAILDTREVCYYTVNAQGKLDIACF